MPSESRALTEAETARQLGVSTATLRNWRKQQTGPTYRKFGRTIRYMQADVDAFVERHAGEHAETFQRPVR